MNIRKTIQLIHLCAALGAAPVGHAAVKCSVVCLVDSPACLPPAGSAKAGQQLHVLSDCENEKRTLAAPASVWYSRKTLLVSKTLLAGSELHKAVVDGDQACPGWTCLFKLTSGRVTGANPMGQKVDLPINPAAVAAGLPYEEVAVPAGGLDIRLDPAGGTNAGGSLVLMDATGQRYGPYPTDSNRVRVPPGVLKAGEGYAYQWAAPGAAELQGSFKVAQPGTVRRANAAAAAAAASTAVGARAEPTPAITRLAQASAYLQVGLQWNAQQLIAEAERGD